MSKFTTLEQLNHGSSTLTSTPLQQSLHNSKTSESVALYQNVHQHPGSIYTTHGHGSNRLMVNDNNRLMVNDNNRLMANDNNHMIIPKGSAGTSMYIESHGIQKYAACASMCHYNHMGNKKQQADCKKKCKPLE